MLPLPIPKTAPSVSIPSFPSPHFPLLTLHVPVLRLLDEEQQLSDIELSSPNTSDDDTKKSFKFTEELVRLNESGNRHSFVEQLENAFQTPFKVDLFMTLGDFLAVGDPPFPKIPEHLADEKRSTVSSPVAPAVNSSIDASNSSASELVLDDSIDSSTASKLLNYDSSVKVARAPESPRSEGELNRHFRFGGRPPPSAIPSSVVDSPLTL